MIKKIFLLVLTLIQISLEENITNIIVLPFKTNKESYDKTTPFNITSLVKNHIYSEINMTNQILISSFKSDEYSFYMTDKNCLEKSNYYIQKSPYFTNLSDFSTHQSGFASERMYLSRSLDLNIKQYGFFPKMLIESYSFQKQCAIFGLKIKTEHYEYNEFSSFISTFKTNGNIKGYQWTLKYITDDEGLLVIGDSPLEYDPNFKNKKYIEYKTNAIISKSFGLKFDEIMMNNENLDVPKDVQFYHDINGILVKQKFYDKIIDIFFIKYLDNYRCEKKWEPSIYGYIQCHGNNFTDNDIKSFPTIYFKHIEMNYIFELNYNDLFTKEKNGEIYFLILFNLKDSVMKFGKPFLKKYPFTVDNDKYTISLFVEEKAEKKNYTLIIVLSVVVFVLLSLLLFFGYKLLIKKGPTKKRANELDEEYEYVSQNDKKISLANNLGV